MKYLHQLTYPEVVESKEAVTDICGFMWGGPDRKGANAPQPNDLWITWQREIGRICMDLNNPHFANIPENVHQYYQSTKQLTAAPKADPAKVVIDITPKKKLLADPPRFTCSYSRMNDFLTCPAKWAAGSYFKTTVWEETEEIKWGNRVHKALEKYLLGQALAADEQEIVKTYGKYTTAMLGAKAKGATVAAEKQMCFTKDMKLCGWKDWNTVWFRGQADVIIVQGDKLTVFDYKTGKLKPDLFQLEVMCAVASLYYPEAQQFDGKLLFLKEDDPKKAIVPLPAPLTREDLKDVWSRVFEITNRMEQAWEAENFRMQTSGLCKSWCGHFGCVHNGRRG